MFDKKKREAIGNRARARRKELKLPLQYVAERMGVSASTIQRYESGAIDNTKKLVIEGLAEVLHVSPAWLETGDDYFEPDKTDLRFVYLEEAFSEVMGQYPLKTEKNADAFSKDLLILLLNDYKEFNKSFAHAVNSYSGGNAEIAKEAGFASEKELNDAMFLRWLMSTINALSEVCDILRNYSDNPQKAHERIREMLREAGQIPVIND